MEAPDHGDVGHLRGPHSQDTLTELGVICLSDIQTGPATGKPYGYRQRLDEMIGYATLADRLGLDVFELGEHHRLDFAMSSPAVALAIAARTSRIRLTSGATVLSVLDPVRVYQDFATALDLISHGRAEITAGRAFTEPFGISGRPARQHNAPITPRAHQQPLPVWPAVGSSPDRADRLGLPMVLGYMGGPLDHARRTVDI